MFEFTKRFTAFLVGSRAYGTPLKNSDLDLVIMTDEKTKSILLAHSESSDQVTFGKLNILICTEEKQYNAWKHGLNIINKILHPISREHVVQVFQEARKKFGAPEEYKEPRRS